MAICLEQGADLHMAQLMPLPVAVSYFSKIRIGCTFLGYRPTRVVPDKGPLNGFVVLLLFLRVEGAVASWPVVESYAGL